MNNLILIIVFSLCSTILISQNKVRISKNQKFLVDQFTDKEGLSDNSVKDILQDKNGYLWLGTTDGLNKFDGYSFTVFRYKPGDHTSISNNNVNDLLENKDGKIWVATEGGLNLYDPNTEEFSQFQYVPNDDKSISHNIVKCIYEDAEGVLWVGTKDGLCMFNTENRTFERYKHKQKHSRYFEKEPSYEINRLIDTKDGKLIVGYWGMGLMLFDKKKKTYEQIPIDNKFDKFALNLTVDNLAKDKNGNLWVVASGVLFLYEKDKGLRRIHDKEVSLNDSLSTFVPSSSGQFLVGGNHQRGGFYLLDQNTTLIDQFTSLSTITTIIEDMAGDIWLATRGSGIYHLNTQGSFFTSYSSNNKSFINSLTDFGEDKICVATSDQGLYLFNTKNKTFESISSKLQYPNSLLTKKIGSVFKDSKDNIWIGTWGTGVTLYHPKTETIQYFRSIYKDDSTPSDKYIYEFLETKENEIWVATPFGLCTLSKEEDIQEGKFRRYKHIPGDSTSLNNLNISCIYQRQNGQIWIGTSDGLHRYNRANDNFILYRHDIDNLQSINNNNILTIAEDQNQQLWIGTKGGLNKFSDNDNSFSHIKEQKGLLEKKISSIHIDNKSRLWLRTKKGLIRYNPQKNRVKLLSAKDGLLNPFFSRLAFFISKKTKHIYIGTNNGITVFHPDSIQDNSFIPPVHISSLKIYAEKNNETLETNIKGISNKEKIELSYQDNIITFKFSSLNYRSTSENQYAYKLDGFNENWINIGTKREITFTNLDPGNYTLLVKGSNNDGIWNEDITTLKINISPPWWRTNLAYFLYSLSSLFILFTIYRTLLRRQELQHQLQSEKSKASRLKELDSFKTRLTTNLTHEFRTPLTVILGMASQIKNEPNKYLEEGTRLIQRNGKNLLRLINQLLDLSKLENKSFQLNLKQGDIVPFLSYITASFQSFANGKNLSLRFNSSVDSLLMDYDAEQIKQILTNLISNALKFTPMDGKIVVQLKKENNFLQLEVIDSGIGISEKELPNIFDRFYQVDGSMTREGEGTGIGLAHSKELVNLMKGEISAKSTLGKGTTFFLKIPIRNNATFEEHILKEMDSPESFSSLHSIINIENKTVNLPIQNKQDLPQILIVEDNPDVVVYLQTCLENFYHLDIAYNGKIGIEKATKNIPDLIISDVMMPEKDGFEVCDFLKNDERTSHMPIILLTAKADASSKIAGLKRGADAYLSKPFDKEELLIRLEKLLDRQKKMVAYFSSQAIVANPSNPIVENLNPENEVQEVIQIEDVFIQKVKKIIEENYSDEHFALPQLCQKIRMSRSQLFRKLKALIDTSPSEFIRKYRLEKAKYLLETTDMNVSEVSWEVGFKDVSHFSKTFQSEFGYLPSKKKK